MSQEQHLSDLIVPSGTSSTSVSSLTWFTTKAPNLEGRHVGLWLRNKLNALYSDPVYTRGNDEVKNYYKKQAYSKWVVPYFNHIGREVPITEEEFLDPKVRANRIDWHNFLVTGSIRDIQKTGLAMVKQTDRTIAGITDLLATITEPTPTIEESIQLQALKKFGSQKEVTAYESTLNQKMQDRRRNSLYGKLKYSEEYWDTQAQDIEDRIQARGGHTAITRLTELGTQAIFFESTGAAKASEALRIANPRTADYATRVLKAEWNGAITGLFYGASSGVKAKDLHDEAETFMLFGLAGATGTRLLKFLNVFSKVSTPELTKTVVTSTAQKLLKGEGVPIPTEELIAKATSETNKAAAEAGIAYAINASSKALYSKEAIASVARGAEEASQPNINEAFKKLTPQQQKNVITRLFGALSDAHNTAKFDLAQQVAPAMLAEEEAKIIGVVPAAQKIQESVDNFVKHSGADPVQAKLGAILPHHNTHIDSPIGHVAARMAWLRRQAENPDVSAAQRLDFKSALEDEKTLYKTIKTKLKLKNKGIQ